MCDQTTKDINPTISDIPGGILMGYHSEISGTEDIDYEPYPGIEELYIEQAESS